MGAAEEATDLEALFDRVAAEAAKARTPAPVAAVAAADKPAADAARGALTPYDVFQRIGTLTRDLHDALVELGYEQRIELAVSNLPDARARLAYVASLTGKAAERVLAAVERSKAQQERLRGEAAELGARWERLFRGELSLEGFTALAADTRRHFARLPEATAETDRELTEIMMAQDFHDLTGQVIQRIAGLAQNLEDELVHLLLDTTPPERRGTVKTGWLNGPTIDAAGRDDVVTSQGQVDELLESLGF